MKRTVIAVALAACCGVGAMADDSTTVNTNAASTSPAANPAAMPATTRNDSGNGMAGRFGAGVMLGEPTGPSLKYFFSDELAVDGAFGWSLHDHSNFYLQSDVLWHNYDLLPVSQGRLPVYFGGGMLARFRNSGENDQFAVRVPVGVSYLFDNAPVDVFAEIGPALDLAPSLRGEITGGVGIRLWF